MISGRTIIGDNTWVGVGTTVSNGLVVGKEARLNIGSVVTKDISDGLAVSGTCY